MSSTLHKIADKLTGKDKHVDNPESTNYGPHSSNIANKADPRIDSDADGRNNPASHVGGYGDTQTTGTHTGYTGTTHTTTGLGHTAGDNYHSTNAGPHDSNLANKMDPRVDSDRDGRAGLGGHTTHSQHVQQPGSGISASTNPGYDNPQSTNTGPHSSNILNKLDPRVDSDRDGRNDPTSRVGGYNQTQIGGTGYAGQPTQPMHTGATGLANTGTTYDHPSSTNTGPHSSNIMNKLDPRVDSDRDGRNDPTSRVGGYGQTQTHTATGGGVGVGHTTTGAQGYTGTNTGYDNPKSTNTGPHSSNLLNKLDPRVDSDRDGRDDPTSRVGGYGQTQTTGSVGRY